MKNGKKMIKSLQAAFIASLAALSVCNAVTEGVFVTAFHGKLPLKPPSQQSLNNAATQETLLNP